MKPSIYIETTIVSYLTARPTHDVIRHGQQLVTRRWWRKQSPLYSLFASQAVIEEAERGDAEAASKRLQILRRIHLLDITDSADRLVERLLSHNAFPREAEFDAYHLAIATIHHMEYLLTWNCRHLANAQQRDIIESTCQEADLTAPIICTPYELLGVT